MKKHWTVADSIRAYEEGVRRSELSARLRKPHLFKSGGKWFVAWSYNPWSHDEAAHRACDSMNLLGVWPR